MCSGSRARTALDPPPATTAFFSASDSSPAERAAAAAAAAAAAVRVAEDADDGRLSERLARLQQEQLQQVPRGLCVQGLEPPSLSIPADPRVPVRTDHCDRKDEHTSAVPAPAMG